MSNDCERKAKDFERWKACASDPCTSVQVIADLATSILLHNGVLTADVLFLAALRPGVTLAGVYKVAAGMHTVPYSGPSPSQFTIRRGLVEFVTARIRDRQCWLSQLLKPQEGFEAKLCRKAVTTFGIAVSESLDFDANSILPKHEPSHSLNQRKESETLDLHIKDLYKKGEANYYTETLRHRLRIAVELEKSSQRVINKLTEEGFCLMQMLEAQKKNST